LDTQTSILIFITIICCSTLTTVIVTTSLMLKRLTQHPPQYTMPPYPQYNGNGSTIAYIEKPKVYRYTITASATDITPLLSAINTELKLPYSITPSKNSEDVTLVLTSPKKLQINNFEKKCNVKCEQVDAVDV